MIRSRHLLGALFAALLFFASTGVAQAQPRQEGLVNVNITDVNVQIPIALVANICGVAVNVLAQDVETGLADCEGVALAEAENGNDDRRRGGPNQRGLINVNLTDVNVQIPIAVVANICGVAVNVLVQDVETGLVECEGVALAEAA